MFKKITALAMICVTLLSLFACSGETFSEANVFSAVEKVGELNLKKDPFIKTKPSLNANYGGVGGSIIYVFPRRGNSKGGVVSLDGDTGKYERFGFGAHYDPVFHIVSSVELKDPALECVNSLGLIDGKGKEIIPQEYAEISILNDRYAKVVKATGITYNTNNTLVTIPIKKSIFSDYESFSYSGVWYIYDMLNGRLLEKVSDTKKYGRITAYGQFISCIPSNDLIFGEEIVYDSNGNLIDTSRTAVFEDGSYAVNSGYGTNVYDADGNFLFSCSSNGYVPCERNEDSNRFIAKKTTGWKTEYAVMDLDGNVISVEFEDYIESAAGNLLITYEGGVCNLKGQKVVDGDFDWLHYNKRVDSYGLKENLLYTNFDMIIKEDGKVLYSKNDEHINVVSEYHHTLCYCFGEKNMYYCYAKNDFTIAGEESSKWLVKNGSEIIDTVTGETLIRGYLDYIFSPYDENTVYVYANKGNYNYDVYVINYENN
ncbi:MAG: hypothetical protein IJA87_03870 [Clostridia bacterium]|nr:hypothetical protein [Clostridia bacterium]